MSKQEKKENENVPGRYATSFWAMLRSLGSSPQQTMSVTTSQTLASNDSLEVKETNVLERKTSLADDVDNGSVTAQSGEVKTVRIKLGQYNPYALYVRRPSYGP